MRQKLPFGIAQIGKSFRNEITPGNFIFRTREFEQMEMEFFVQPGDGARVATTTGRRSAIDWYVRYGMRPEQPAHCARTRPTSSRTTPDGTSTSSTSIRSAGASSRASPTAATST